MKKLLFLLFIVVFLVYPQNNFTQWRKTNGPYGGSVKSLVHMGKKIFAGTQFGMYRAQSTGGTWDIVGAEWSCLRGTYSAATPGKKLLAGTENGVLTSNDSGDTWNGSHSSVQGKTIYDIEQIGNKTYVAAGQDGLYCSSDSGSSFTKVQSFSGDVRTIAQDGSDIIVGTADKGCLITKDQGNSFESLNSGFTGTIVQDLLVDNQIVYSASDKGIHRKDAGSVVWAGGNSLPTLRTNSLVKHNSYLAAGTSDGVYVSSNSGSTWDFKGAGLPSGNINKVYSDGTKLWAATETGGVFYSGDNAATWLPYNTGLSAFSVTKIIQAAGKIYAATDKSGVFVTSNNGETWDDLTHNLSYKIVNDIAANQNKLFICFNQGGIKDKVIDPDTSNQWDNVSVPKENADANSAIFSGSQFYVNVFNVGIFESSNMGTQWILSTSHLKKVNAMAEKDGRTYAAADSNDFGVKENDFSNWIEKAPFTADINIKGVSTNSTNNTVVAASFGQGISISTNSGDTWYQPAQNGMLNKYLISVAQGGDAIIASAKWNSVYASTDGGDNWQLTNPDMGETGFSYVIVLSNNAYLGTMGRGVWKRPLSEITTALDKDIPLPTEYVLKQNYPNPFNPITTIYFSLPKRERARLKIFDSLGREIEELINEDLNAGSHSKIWNANNMPSGIYFYQLTAGSKTISKKMVLLK